MINTAVFISGGGTNLQSIIDYWQQGGASYDLKLVICNQADVYGLERAKKAGIPCVVISHKDFSSRRDFDQAMDQHLESHGIELIALAGFMRLLSSWFVQKWSGKLINIHPSLLPAFPGLHTHRKALEYGVKFSGCSVFFVDEGVDSGAMINQAVVDVLPDDTEERLAKRVLIQEHIIFPAALDLVAKGQVCLLDGKVITRH